MTNEIKNTKPSSSEVARFYVERASALATKSSAERDPISWYYESSHVGDVSALALALLTS